MKKTILMFFLVIIVIVGYVLYVSGVSLFTTPEGGLVKSWDVGDTEENGDDWLAIPDEAAIGDTFTGSSGTTYILKEESIPLEEKRYMNEVIGISCDGVWVSLENGLIMSNDISNVKEEDWYSEPDPKYVNIGDKFTGPSGTTYILKEENISLVEKKYMNEVIGISCDGIWVKVEFMSGN